MLRSLLVTIVIYSSVQLSFGPDTSKEFNYSEVETDVNFIQEAELIDQLNSDPDAFQPN